MSKFEYFDVSLEAIIRFYIENALIEKEWEILAIDMKRDRVVFKRFEASEEKR